jgi:hypothetical protein
VGSNPARWQTLSSRNDNPDAINFPAAKKVFIILYAYKFFEVLVVVDERCYSAKILDKNLAILTQIAVIRQKIGS